VESEHMISAIIPCYNAEPFLAEAIESVLKQTRPVGEIIVVDDGSTDRSAEIARSYGARLVSMGRNRGHAAARNAGADAARGDLLAWLDADDYWDANHCEVVCGLLERHPEAAFAYAANRLVGTKSGIHYTSPRDHELFDAFWVDLCDIYPVNWVIWRSAYLEVGGFDSRIRFAPDFDFCLRLSRRFKFISTPEITSVYRWHPAQISSSSWKEQIRSNYETRNRLLQTIRQGGEEELARLVEKKMLAIFDDDIRNAWWNPERLRVLVTLRALVPGNPPAGPRIWLQSRLSARVVSRWVRVRARLGQITRFARLLRAVRGGS
jgi:glycosyltransferase involved in cell wall biosynthesis